MKVLITFIALLFCLFSEAQDYYLIYKIEKVESDLVYSQVGYVTTDSDAETIESENYANFESWIETNKTSLNLGSKKLIDYFDASQVVYFVKAHLTKIDALDTTLITDINNLP